MEKKETPKTVINIGPSLTDTVWLGCFLVLLKATGYVDWSWWGVLLPFYWPFALLLGIAAIGGVVFLLVLGWTIIMDTFDSRQRKHQRTARERITPLKRLTAI